MKQAGLAGGTVPPSVAIPPAREGGQPTIEVSPTVEVVEVSPNVSSFLLVNRKRDDGARVSGQKKSRVLLSLCTLR